MQPRLRLDALSVRFGGIQAVQQVSLQIAPGEIRGLIGPNGAGKTTAINAITGAVPVFSGDVFLDDTRITGLPTHAVSRLGIRRTFQHVEPFSELTLLENVLLGLSSTMNVSFAAAALHWTSARSAEKQAIDESYALLERFDLLPHAQVRAAELPFGLLKRMDLARALASRPKLLMMDEPTSGMSESEADAAIRAARELAEETGVTLLVIEHNMRVMMALAHSITVMNQGKVIAEGSPSQVQANPAVIDAYLGEESDASR